MKISILKCFHSILAVMLCFAIVCGACFTTVGAKEVYSSEPGDVDGDGSVNLNDLITLAQYVAKWDDIEYNPFALDVDGNGIIELQDVTYLAQLLMGWYEEDNKVPNIKVENMEKFAVKFTNSSFVYRVGNQNTVALGSLFEAVEGRSIDAENINITLDSDMDASVTYTANTDDWTKGTLQFSGTGIVDVTITDNYYCNPTVLTLELVDATNVTQYSELKNYNTTSVLLNDITMGTNSALYLNGGATLYGNGFTFDCTNGAYTASGSVSENYVIGLVDAHLDNVKVIGKVYTEYGAQASNDYNRALVVSKGNSTITNCYLSNTASPIRLVEGTLVVKGTTVKGGNFANIDVRNGHLTVEDVTTINQALSNDKAADDTTVIGLGIVVFYENVDSALTSVTINGTLTQYNNISSNDTFTHDYATQFVNQMMTGDYAEYRTEIDGVKWVNTGIIALCDGIVPVDNRADVDGYIGKSVSFMAQNGYVYSVKPTEASIAENVAEYETLGQGIIAPEYSFDYTTKNYVQKTDDSNDYCYYDSGKVLIAMDQGDTFEWDPFILTTTKYGNTLDYTVSMNGTNYTSGSKIAFNESGDYVVEYNYTDNYNYRVVEGNVEAYSQTYTKTVNISVSVIKPSAQHATFTFADTNTATEKVTLGDKTYISATGVSATDKEWGYITVDGTNIFYPITEAQMKKNTFGTEVQVFYYVFKDTVTITDYADGGTGAAQTYNSSTTTMPSNLSVVNGMEAKYTSISSACVDVSKLTKDGPSGEVWDFSASTTVSGTTTYNGYLAHSSPSGLSIKSGTRDYDAITVAQFSYTDAAGATYYYFVGYFMANQVSSSSGSDGQCVTPDTLITLADGSKVRVDSLKGDEMLLVWNLETGKYEAAPIVFVDSDAEMEYEIIHLYFSNGTDVKVISEHGFFDLDLGKYVYIDADNYAEYIGHRFVSEGDMSNNNWNIITLDNVVIEKEVTTAWSPVTFKQLCYYTNGVLSMPGGIDGLFNIFEVDTETMTYDAEQMQKDIETYGLFTLEDFGGLIPEIAYEAFNGNYLKVAIAKGMLTWEDIAYLAERYVPLV